MYNQLIVMLSGKARVGKDTFADALINDKVAKISFAFPLKIVTMRLIFWYLGTVLVIEEIENKTHCLENGTTIRTCLQTIATIFRDVIHEDIWSITACRMFSDIIESINIYTKIEILHEKFLTFFRVSNKIIPLWIIDFFNQMETCIHSPIIVISDLRYPNEYNFIKSHFPNSKIATIKITRSSPNDELTEVEKLHQSENSFDSNIEFDFTILNSYNDLSEYREKARFFLSRICLENKISMY